MAPTLRSKQPKAQRKQQPKAQPQPKVKTQLEPVTPSPVKIAVHPAPAAAELIAVKKQTKRTPKKRSPAKANIQQTPQSSPKKPKRIEYTNAELDMFAADALPLVLAAGPGGWPACDAKGGMWCCLDQLDGTLWLCLDCRQTYRRPPPDEMVVMQSFRGGMAAPAANNGSANGNGNGHIASGHHGHNGHRTQALNNLNGCAAMGYASDSDAYYDDMY